METNGQESYAAIEALEECIHTCQDCASHDIRHGGEMATCALLNLDCADICAATMNAMARHSAHHGDFAKLAAHICRECAAECAAQRSAPSTTTSIANVVQRLAKKRLLNSTNTRVSRICKSEAIPPVALQEAVGGTCHHPVIQ